MDLHWTLALAVPVALGIDRWLGEPAARWHPVVWMGKYLGWAGRLVAPRAGADGSHTRSADAAFWGGAAFWCAGAFVVGALAWSLQNLAWRVPPWAGALLLGLALKPLLAWRMLHDEVAAVEAALSQSLDAGRARLARLVSRDVAQLDALQVRESAIESLAENLNDSVVAPLFWFAVAGLPGAAVYRFANTADAMWGYRGERGGRVWEWAGKGAARADDVLSWLPARITALLILLGASRWKVRGLPAEAARTPSPNSGWPMAAMALALGVRLRKPGVYTLNAAGRACEPADTARAAAWAGAAVAIAGVLSAMLAAILPGAAP